MSKEDPEQLNVDMKYYVNPDDTAQVTEGQVFFVTNKY